MSTRVNMWVFCAKKRAESAPSLVLHYAAYGMRSWQSEEPFGSEIMRAIVMQIRTVDEGARYARPEYAQAARIM
ncbi:MAG: hypothetical protein ACT4QC_22580 [Planctomycetaceae bacterium]